MKRFLPFITLAIASLAIALVVQSTVQPSVVRAAGGTITGWLWSDNIGWVSMSCTNTASCASQGGVDYGVTQQSDGSWTGYGWSENVGWLKFDAGCPSGSTGQCTAKMVGTSLLGWARFCAGTTAGDCTGSSRTDWDGWVSLSCNNTTGCATSNYGPVQSGTQITGYGWGSDVVGWISFALSSTAVSSYSITASSGANGTVTPAGVTTVPAGGSQTYAITPSAGYSIASLSVDSVSVPIQNSFTFSNVTLDHFISATFAPSAAGPTASVTVGDTSLFAGQSTTLSWNCSANTASCTGTNFNTQGLNSGTMSISPATTTTYTVRATNANGSANDSKTVIVSTPGGTQCSDGIDNDNPPDGKIDYAGGPNGEPADPGCSSAADDSEADPKPIFIEF